LVVLGGDFRTTSKLLQQLEGTEAPGRKLKPLAYACSVTASQRGAWRRAGGNRPRTVSKRPPLTALHPPGGKDHGHPRPSHVSPRPLRKTLQIHVQPSTPGGDRKVASGLGPVPVSSRSTRKVRSTRGDLLPHGSTVAARTHEVTMGVSVGVCSSWLPGSAGWRPSREGAGSPSRQGPPGVRATSGFGGRQNHPHGRFTSQQRGIKGNVFCSRVPATTEQFRPQG